MITFDVLPLKLASPLLDIAVSDEAVNNAESNIAVLIGKGDGTFAMPVAYPVGAEPHTIAMGDLNLDGKLDLVTANQFFNGSLSFLIGNGDGTFQPDLELDADGAAPTSVAVADFR